MIITIIAVMHTFLTKRTYKLRLKQYNLIVLNISKSNLFN